MHPMLFEGGENSQTSPFPKVSGLQGSSFTFFGQWQVKSRKTFPRDATVADSLWVFFNKWRKQLSEEMVLIQSCLEPGGRAHSFRASLLEGTAYAITIKGLKNISQVAGASLKTVN